MKTIAQQRKFAPHRAYPYLSLSVAKLLTRRARFSLGVAHVGLTVGFTVKKVALGHVFLCAFRFSCGNWHSNKPPFSCIIGGWQNMPIYDRSTT
jgi:hypothetical protein